MRLMQDATDNAGIIYLICSISYLYGSRTVADVTN